MEKLLHYIWKHRIFPPKTLQTADGRAVEILDVGMHNTNQGPDFFNAKVKLGDTVWAGCVEIHLKSSDWFRHGPQQDARDNNTILHVVQETDCEVETLDGRHPAQLRLPIPEQTAASYLELCQTDDYPRCHKIIPSLEPMKVHAWMDALLAERLTERAGRVLARLSCTRWGWSSVVVERMKSFPSCKRDVQDC